MAIIQSELNIKYHPYLYFSFRSISEEEEGAEGEGDPVDVNKVESKHIKGDVP